MMKTKIIIGLYLLIFLILVALKLTNIINWSWLLVTIPLWIDFAIFVVFLTLFFIIKFVFLLLKYMKIV